jgi:hypothetical protein
MRRTYIRSNNGNIDNDGNTARARTGNAGNERILGNNSSTTRVVGNNRSTVRVGSPFRCC